MTPETTKDIKVWQIACNDGERYLRPTQAAIEAMKKSLLDNGQIHPISVYPVSIGKYRLIAGATRFRAASALMWPTIRATVWMGSAVEFQIHELIENVERRELTSDQRKEMKVRIRQLQAERLAAIKASKGGRGIRGGVSEEARQMGISEGTARNRRKEKPRKKEDIYEVSDDQPKADATQRPRKNHIASAHMSPEELAELDEWAVEHNMTRSDGMRLIIRERVAADKAAKRKATIRLVP